MEKKRVICEIEIPEYETHAKMSSSRRPTYFKKKAKKPLPKKYQSKNYRYGKEGVLVDKFGRKVVANSLSVGKPRMWKINGQGLYSGSLHPKSRAKLTEWAHQYLGQFVQPIKPIHIPKGKYLAISLTMYGVLPENQSQNWDCSNQWIWIKWFEDTLVEYGKIPDDSILFIRDSGGIKFRPVEDHNQRKLIFTISYDS